MPHVLPFPIDSPVSYRHTSLTSACITKRIAVVHYAVDGIVQLYSCLWGWTYYRQLGTKRQNTSTFQVA